MLATQLARYMISFSWLYHGFFPKLFHVAPLEKIMTANFGFAEDISLRITQTAGVAEILFGIVFFYLLSSAGGSAAEYYDIDWLVVICGSFTTRFTD